MRGTLQKKLQREEHILSTLKNLDFLSRNQLQRLHGLGGERNARRVMENMKDYVMCFRGESGENIYCLNKSGRELMETEVVRKKTNQAGHYLMRNDVYIYYAGNEDWKNEVKFSVDGVVTLIPDAYFRFNQRRHFLEVDHLQHMNKNKEKIDNYRKLFVTGVFQQKIKYFPRLVWVTLTENRREKLTEWCKGLDFVIHLWNEIN